MSQIPDFTNAELKPINDTLEERYKHAVDSQSADIELRIQADHEGQPGKIRDLNQ